MNLTHLLRSLTRGKPAEALAVMLCAAAVVVSTACGARIEPVEARTRVEVTPSVTVDVIVRLQPDHAAQMPRYVSAASATLRDYTDRFVSLPFATVTIVDPQWDHPQDVENAAQTVIAPTRWLAPSRGMEPEIAVVGALGDRYWRGLFPCTGEHWFLDGLNRFTSMPVIESQFAVQQQPPAFAHLEQRSFGSFVPFVSRIPMRIATVGYGLREYRANAHADPRLVGSDRDRASLAAKTALAFGTIQNWIGPQTWDAVLKEFARRGGGVCATPDALRVVAEELAGVDLAWFFQQVFESSDVFDYGVERVASVREPGSDRYRTTIVARRYGEAEFTGTSAPPTGAYESGRGVELRATFADGTERMDYWDGRERWKLFTYEGTSPLRSAEVDPRAVLLLDVNRTNNSRSTAALGDRAAAKWSGRWLVWLDDLLLTYASLL